LNIGRYYTPEDIKAAESSRRGTFHETPSPSDKFRGGSSAARKLAGAPNSPKENSFRIARYPDTIGPARLIFQLTCRDNVGSLPPMRLSLTVPS